MKVLSIGTDRLIFATGSDVRRRLLDYGELFSELHVIVFAKKNLGYKKEQLADNIFIYPTNSRGRLSYLWDAFKIGRILLAGGAKEDWTITSQDPFETGLVAWWLKRKRGIKWQAQIHTDFLSPFFARESWLNWLRVKMASFLLPRADKVRVVSERIKKSLETWVLKNEPVVLPIFVSPELGKVCDSSMDLHKKYSQFSFIILMASRLTREKNFPLALGAFVEVVLARPNIGLVIVGQGPERTSLQNLAKATRSSQQIIFEEWQENLNCYYQTADLFLLSSNYEGYGRTIIEAGLNGCPVLTTDIGIVGEIVKESNALICPVGDEDCLVQKISWAIANHGQLPSLGAQLKNDLSQKIINNKGDYLNDYRQAIEK